MAASEAFLFVSVVCSGTLTLSSLSIEQEIGRLDVAMHNALLMRVMQRFRDLHADARHALPVSAPRIGAIARFGLSRQRRR